MENKEKIENFKNELFALFRYKVGFELTFERMADMISEYNLEYSQVNKIIESAIKKQISKLSPQEKKSHDNLFKIVKIAVERIWEKDKREVVLALIMIYVYSGDTFSNWRKLPDLLRKYMVDNKWRKF